MKKLVILTCLLFATLNIFAQKEEDMQISKSPYLIINGDIKELKTGVELSKTNVDVNISGIIADVTVKQFYRNTSDKVLEAIYVFPASVNAAVYSMKMKIGSREIIAVIKEKAEARREYEAAKLEGKRVSLLEQERPNIFQMNLANIAPGDFIEIEMKYTEMLTPDDKIYTFSFPAIVAPRYGGAVNNEEGQSAVNKTYVSNAPFDLKFNLISPVPIEGIECITHEVNYSAETANHSLITLKDFETKGTAKDYVVKYKLCGDLINSGLLLSKSEEKGGENFFLLTVQPPKRIEPAYIPPREYIFVLDVSGSMSGFPLITAKKTLLNLLDKLEEDDKFNLILFASGYDVFSENLVTATRQNLKKAFQFMAESRQGGGTELLPALEMALKFPKNSKASRSIVIITDGLISFETKAFELIRNNLNKANLFTFGIGTSMNKLTIQGMARAGMGLSFEANREEDAEYQSERFIKYISTPILTDIKVTYDGFKVSEVEPMAIPDLFPDRPIVIYGKWDGNLQGGIRIEALNGQEKIFVDLPITKFGEMVQGDALKQIWARKQIELLSDYQNFGEFDKYKKEITDIGLKYNLMTAYTSFIAVDKEKINSSVDENQNLSDETNIIRSSIGKGTITNYHISNNPTRTNIQGIVAMSAGVQHRGSRAEIASEISLNYSKPSIFDRVQSWFDNSPEVDIEYDESELLTNIEQAQNCKNNNSALTVTVKIKIDKNNQILSIKVLDSPGEEYSKIAKEAISKTHFKAAIRSGKSIKYSKVFSLKITLGTQDSKFNFEGNTYPSKIKYVNNVSYMISILKNGIGEKIQTLDKVKFEYGMYDENSKFIEKGEITTNIGLGEISPVLENALEGIQKDGEVLIRFDKYQLNSGTALKLKNVPNEVREIFIKIKVVEINK